MDEIEIPPHFVCPISLQLMRDPVTIATGITYDRESIEKWLFSCKNKACPVTKQVLQNSDLTPNHTLRRLIQAWCTLNASHGIERIPTPKPQVDKTQISKLLKDAKKGKFPEMQIKCLKRLRSIALKEGERSRSYLKDDAGLVDFLVSIIKQSFESTLLLEVEHSNINNEGSKTEFIEASDEALSILYHIKVSETCLKSIISNDHEFVESVVKVLKNGNYQSRAYAAMLLKDIFQIADPVQLIGVTPEFFAEILRVLRDQISQQASKAALKLLVELCPWGRNRVKAVEGGAVFVLTELLLETTSAIDKRSCELALVALDQVCGCAEGRAELLRHAAGLAVVSKKIFRVSHAASERAVRIISSICRFSATRKVLEEMLQVGVVAKLCLVIQVDSSHKAKEKAREILKLHSRVWKNSPCIPSNSYPSDC